jgi:hypothetical protein
VSIDVEGAELEVLESFNWEIQNPRLIVIEIWNPESKNAVDIRNLLTTQGYKLVEKVSFNEFWLSN